MRAIVDPDLRPIRRCSGLRRSLRLNWAGLIGSRLGFARSPLRLGMCRPCSVDDANGESSALEVLGGRDFVFAGHVRNSDRLRSRPRWCCRRGRLLPLRYRDQQWVPRLSRVSGFFACAITVPSGSALGTRLISIVSPTCRTSRRASISFFPSRSGTCTSGIAFAGRYRSWERLLDSRLLGRSSLA